MRLVSKLRRWLFGIDDIEVSFSRRGFPLSSAELQNRLEMVGLKFLEGYHAALEESCPDSLGVALNRLEPEFRGFAFEGAAMALALVDSVSPFNNGRWQHFLASSGAAHRYMLHVGYGWALARLPWLRWNLMRRLERFDPLLRWLVLDGYGFHEGYFHWRKQHAPGGRPKLLSAYARRAFDQGLGRSLWFSGGGDIDRIVRIVAGLEPERHADLWSGVGLACTYAGAISDEEVARLAEQVGEHRLHLAQGAAFAAKARQLADNMAAHTQRVCHVLCGMDVACAAAVTDKALADLPPDEPDRPAFEEWRSRIRSRLALRVSRSYA